MNCQIHGASVLCKRSVTQNIKMVKLTQKRRLPPPPPPGQPRTAATKGFQHLQGVPKEAYLSAFTKWVLRQKNVFLCRVNTSKG